MVLALPDTVTFLGADIPFWYAAGSFALVLVAMGVCCWAVCCRTPKVHSGEKFSWPSSARYLKHTDPGNPPKLFVNKYEDPMRTDTLPVEDESYWNVVYQPNGEREEVRQQMYLRFRDGIVYGLGYETIRKLCKISGKYKLNERSNQTTLAFTCREIPGIRSMGGDKSKGSFLMLKMASMGDPKLRVRLHCRRVHKWAGNLFPDDSAPLPTSPMHSPKPATGKSREVYTSVGMDSTAGSTASSRSSSTRTRRSKRRGSGTEGGRRKKLLSILTFGRRRRQYVEPFTPTSPAGTTAEHGKDPPWVQRGAFGDDDDDEVDNYSVTPSTLGRSQRSPATDSSRPSFAPGIDTMNYLEVEGVPGRSGPSMV